MKSTLFLMVGIPGSGKSTWIANQIDSLEQEQYKVISRDEIRFAMLKPGEDYFLHENAVFAQFIKSINDAIANKVQYIFIDATHISPGSRAKVLQRVREPASTSLVVEVFNTPLETCLERNSKRTGLANVPAASIKSMARGFSHPTMEEFTKYHFSSVKIWSHGKAITQEVEE